VQRRLRGYPATGPAGLLAASYPLHLSGRAKAMMLLGENEAGKSTAMAGVEALDFAAGHLLERNHPAAAIALIAHAI
jgi:AAA domain